MAQPKYKLVLLMMMMTAMATISMQIHIDGSARVQTVSEDDEPWLHALLTAVAHFGRGAGILVTQSMI